MGLFDRLAAVASSAAAARRGVELVEKGDRAAGFHLLAKAAARGNRDAMFQVGKSYLEGRGVPQSRGDAATWLERAGEAGHIEAQALLAALLLHGTAGADAAPDAALFASRSPIGASGPNYAAASVWAKRAAEAGSGDAQALMGYVLTTGPEEMRDLAAAEQWYRRSAAAGCPQGSLGLALALLRTEQPEQQKQAAVEMAHAAQAELPTALYLLGVMNEFGVGLPPNKEAAVPLYRRAAEKNVRSGMARLGLALLQGDGVEQNKLEGESWLRRAAIAGDAEAAAMVGDLYSKGGELPPNYAEAAIWFERAADAGHSHAARALGMLYLTGAGVARDPEEAARWFRKSAEEGNQASLADLANLVLSGVGVQEDLTRTREWFERAAGSGDLVAAFNFGVCLAEGVGVERDDRKAALWLRRAAEGVVNAQVLVRSHARRGARPRTRPGGGARLDRPRRPGRHGGCTGRARRDAGERPRRPARARGGAHLVREGGGAEPCRRHFRHRRPLWRRA